MHVRELHTVHVEHYSCAVQYCIPEGIPYRLGGLRTLQIAHPDTVLPPCAAPKLIRVFQLGTTLHTSYVHPIICAPRPKIHIVMAPRTHRGLLLEGARACCRAPAVVIRTQAAASGWTGDVGLYPSLRSLPRKVVAVSTAASWQSLSR